MPLERKRRAISSMVYRAIRIISDHFLFHKEFIFIREIVVSNGYPLPFVLNVIRVTLERQLFSIPIINSSLKIKQNKINMNTNVAAKENLRKNQVILVGIPYVGRLTSSLEKKWINIAKHVKPTLHVQPIPWPFPKVQTFFSRKDPIPRELLSNVVYVRCTCCSASYIAKTCRQIIRRFAEHGKERLPPLTRSQKLLTPTNVSTIPQHSKRNVPSVNYARNEKNFDKIIEESTPQLPNEEIPKLFQSEIYQHEMKTGRSMNRSNWKLLSKDQKYHRLLVRESIQISKFEPSLNRTVRSVPLIVYSDSSSLLKPKVKMKAGV